MLKWTFVGVLLAVSLLLAPSPAFAQHPDCTFNRISPLPPLDDCGKLVDNLLRIDSNIAGAQRALAALREHLTDAERELLEQGLELIVGEVSGLPTSATGLIDCALDYCGSRFAGAVGAVTGLWDASNSFYDGLSAIRAMNMWMDRLEELKDELEEGERAFAECQARQKEQAKELNEALAYNKAGVPRYPADHPLCNPVTETDDQTTDRQDAEDAIDGGADDVGGPTRDVEVPDWKRVADFNRDEIRSALDFLGSELELCAQFPEADRAGCVNATLRNRQLLTRTINRGIGDSPTATDRLSWTQARDRLAAIVERGAEVSD